MNGIAVDFKAAFKHLTGNSPFPWQEMMYSLLVEKNFQAIESCNLPTGLGKTSVMPLWLIALAQAPDSVPRRLIYIVNRRTVVDQATGEAENIRANLLKPELAQLAENLRSLYANKSTNNQLDDPPLAISTLRGQYADNGEWCADPARPAIVVGTIDMIGSRLLFSGYGLGFKRKPLHAGFLGQDSLIVHDEAHLEPAFQKLLVSIQKEQSNGRFPDIRPLHVMALTATSRSHVQELDAEASKTQPFELTAADRGHDVVQKRIHAKKTMHLIPVEDENTTAERLASLALGLAKDRAEAAVLIFVRKVEDVTKVVDKLRKEKIQDSQVEQLTGTLRGKERDELVEKPVFQRFLSESNRKKGVALPDQPVFLVCTSAGEVGGDISADHLACDLTPFDSMAQRFGRVNRYGKRADTEIHVVHPNEFDSKNEYEMCRKRTLELLRQLKGNASPAAIGELDASARQEAFTPSPKMLDATDILFDAWALTTIKEKLPGRPPVEPYLHGISDWEPPETQVAWREEVEILTDELLNIYNPADLLEDYPLKPHELLHDRTDRVHRHLHKLAEKHGDKPAWIVEGDSIEVTTLKGIAGKDKEALNGKIILLSPSAGGLENGMLNGDADSADDVADQWFLDSEKRDKRRVRVWDEEPTPKGMRLVRTIDLRPNPDEEDMDEQRPYNWRYWRWYESPKSADSDGSQRGDKPVRWQPHTDDVSLNVEQFVKNLASLPAETKTALWLAAKWHDLGKKRRLWQRSIGNPHPCDWLAKSGSKKKTSEITGYRHEFGSLVEVLQDAEFKTQSNEIQDLTLHLVAAHHGRARPHFPTAEAFDPESSESISAEISQRILQNFARLQRQYGRWGLAYLESLLRAADYAASANPSVTVEEETVAEVRS